MEIRILSAGKSMGPYSESQVRQYLSEGLISAADPAYAEGMSEWLPISQLLERMAPVQPAQPPPASNGSTPAKATETTGLRSVRVRTSALPRVKRGPIEIQPLFVGETESVRRARTKTQITIQAPRPTTELPPVAKFVPRDERRLAKGMVDTGQLAPSHFFERPAVAPEASAAPITPIAPAAPAAPPPQPVEDLLTATEAPPAAAPEPEVVPVPQLNLPLHQAPEVEPGKLDYEEEEDTEARGVPHTLYAIWYASLVVGLLALGLILVVIYAVWYFDRPATQGTQSSAAAPVPVVAPAPEGLPTAAELSTRGFARQEKGDLDGALADYNEAISLDPHNIEALSRRALAERDKGKWDAALADYNSVLAYAPDNADAYSNRGYVKQTKGDLDGALADYSEALSLKPTSAEAFYNVGLIKVRRGDIDGGIEAFNKALDLNPKLARAYYNRGNAKSTEGNIDGAIADYTQSIELDPTNAMACFDRGEARMTKGDSAGALADFTQAIAKDGSLAAAYRERANLEVQRGDCTTALADATKSIGLDPKDVSALFSRGQAELGLHTLDHAEADFASYCQAAPHGPDCDNARLYLWVAAAEQNARDKADTDLAAAVLNDWNSSPEDLTSKIADYLVGHIREDELITDAASPDRSLEPARLCRVWYFAGVKHLVIGDTPNALGYFQKSLSTGQKDCPEYLFARTQMVSLGQSRQASSQSSP
jgi:tetratricopeptide (TPR) repeat protein